MVRLALLCAVGIAVPAVTAQLCSAGTLRKPNHDPPAACARCARGGGEPNSDLMQLQGMREFGEAHARRIFTLDSVKVGSKEVHSQLNKYQASKGMAVNRDFEGHSGSSLKQTGAYVALARLPWVQTICEIGFNAGHSAATWLAAAPQANLLIFDIGTHPTVRHGVDFLRSHPDLNATNRLKVAAVTEPQTWPARARFHCLL